MRIGIVGFGFVGQHIYKELEGKAARDVYDIAPGAFQPHTRVEINRCDVAFVCVSTPMNGDGSADLSAIQEVFSWLCVPLAIIRSTIPPGAPVFDNLCAHTVFVPEFIGEGVNNPYREMKQPPFLIIGGDPAARTKAAEFFARIYNAECEFILTDAVTAEMAKYSENYFLALKVSWANELYDICQKVGADFNQMMQAVTHDYRIGRSHTHVYGNQRGWGGRCLPKDLNALLAVAGMKTAPLLAALIAVNERIRNDWK